MVSSVPLVGLKLDEDDRNFGEVVFCPLVGGGVVT